MEPDEDENGRRVDVDYRDIINKFKASLKEEEEEGDSGRSIPVDYKDIINKFKASLKNKARVWYNMYIDGRITDLYSEARRRQSRVGFLLTSIQ